jgi:predicted nucleic acid-binding protein
VKSVFVDTVYWIAITRRGDQWHEPAKAAREALGPVLMVTTDEVLTEYLAALSRGGEMLRRLAVEMVTAIHGNANVKVVAQSRDTFLRALHRYGERLDKDYSLTDCSSMNAMEGEGITEALTNDHHFEQEGFVVLIRRGMT